MQFYISNRGYGIVEIVAEIFEESTLSRTELFEWHKAFSRANDPSHDHV